ncbi:MAG: hypothetical protein ACP5N7_04195 [Candidatus Pacearchaeota archaeon]
MDRRGQQYRLRYYKISQEDIAKKLKISERTLNRFYNKSTIDEKTLTNVALYECINQIIRRKVWELKNEKTSS